MKHQEKKKTAAPLYRKDKQKMKVTTSDKTKNVIKFDADARKEYILGMGKRKLERQVVARELQKVKDTIATQEKRRQNRQQDKNLWEAFESKMKENGGADDDDDEVEMDEVGMITAKTDKNTPKVIDYEHNQSSSDEEAENNNASDNEDNDEDDEQVSSVRVTVQPMSFGKANLLQVMNEKEEIAQEVFERKKQIKEEQREQIEREQAERKAKHFMNSKSYLRTIPGIGQLQLTADELDKKVMEFKKEQKVKKHTVQPKSKMNKSGKKRSRMLQKINNKRKSKE